MGKKKNLKTINNFPIELVINIFNIKESDSITLIELEDKFFVIELIKTEIIQKEINDETVKKEILVNLEKQIKRKLFTEIISKINNNSFHKIDFDKLTKKENVSVKKVELDNQNDDRVLKKELIDQIYAFGEKNVILVADMDFTENYLIYIANIQNV